MSAYLVSAACIDGIVYTRALALRAGYHRDTCETMTDDDLGRMLWQENARSLDARYSDARGSMYEPAEIDAYRKRLPAAVLHAPMVALLKNPHCYAYQSCEHDGWEASAARKLVDTLCGFLEHRMPGYDAAPWGFERGDGAPDPVPLLPVVKQEGA